ncbi:MAG: ATP-binding cassette domain-containing protein [Firmicutes bacterium]|nr:ATP-binding cassette domain-containing protein [Bacillota bacterium]
MYRDEDVILEVRKLKKYFPIHKGLLRRVVGHVKAVDGVDLFVRSGETLGVVGESGCGKTTLGRCIIRLLEPTEGEVLYRSRHDGIIDLAPMTMQELKPYRREIQMIFQDPFSSLNSRMTVEEIVSEPLVVNDIGTPEERRETVAALLENVGLSRAYLDRYPHEFSGGQRQRIGIARALSVKPRVIICDEPVSALDVSVQAQVINLLEELQEKYDFTYIFIAHDLSVIEHISDRVAVLYLGKVVELADVGGLFDQPLHPYTEALLAAIPSPNPDIKLNRELLLTGNVPSPANPPSGCPFHTRCHYRVQRCVDEVPELSLAEGTTDHFVACHRYQELELKPAAKHELFMDQVG